MSLPRAEQLNLLLKRLEARLDGRMDAFVGALVFYPDWVCRRRWEKATRLWVRAVLRETTEKGEG